MSARMTSAGPSDSGDDVRPPSSTTHNGRDRIKSRRKAHERPEVRLRPRQQQQPQPAAGCPPSCLRSTVRYLISFSRVCGRVQGSDQVRQAFSKRKKGLVLKAYQLYKLTDAKVRHWRQLPHMTVTPHRPAAILQRAPQPWNTAQQRGYGAAAGCAAPAVHARACMSDIQPRSTVTQQQAPPTRMLTHQHQQQQAQPAAAACATHAVHPQAAEPLACTPRSRRTAAALDEGSL
jgi:hypothetical protein